MANKDIRIEAKENGVQLWKIAQKLGISESSLTRKFRNELPAEEKNKIREIISALKEEDN